MMIKTVILHGSDDIDSFFVQANASPISWECRNDSLLFSLLKLLEWKLSGGSSYLWDTQTMFSRFIWSVEFEQNRKIGCHHWKKIVIFKFANKFSAILLWIIRK